VVDTEFMTNDFDLITPNEHLHDSDVSHSHCHHKQNNISLVFILASKSVDILYINV
jgi:hypothetical protein